MTTAAPASSCANCRFGLADPTSGNVICRRFPPAVNVVQTLRGSEGEFLGQQCSSNFPTMRASGWCGEHQERAH